MPTDDWIVGWRMLKQTEKTKNCDVKFHIEELETIAARVEDPQTGIDDMEKHIRRSEELVEACRAYLRGAREKLTQN